MKNQKLLNSLAIFFLDFKDPDKSFVNLLRVIRRLNSMGRNRDITANDVQKIAYGYKEGGEK